MGSYLSWPRPRPLAPSLRGEDPPETLESLRPAHPVGRVIPSCRVHSAAPTLDVTRRLSCENLVVSSRRRRYRLRFAIVHRQQYPNHQARFLFLGVFSSVPHTRCPKPVVSPCRPKMFCTSVILKMASAKGKLTLCLALKETVLCMCSSLSGHFPNPCEREIWMRALKENGQAKAKEEKDLTSLIEEEKELAKPEKRHPVPKGQDDLRRVPECSGRLQSAFRRLMVNGVLSSFVPRPGPLKRDFRSMSLADSLIKKSHTCFLSSCSKRNAITSSYSSTRGFPPMPRSFPGTAGIQAPASYEPQVLAKKASEESYHSSSSASVEPQRMIKYENVADAPSGQKQSLRDRSPPPNSTRPQKRKIPLLLSSRRHEPVILPPLPQLGYQVTAEDLDLEKRAAIQWINKALEG
ncbi:nuclear envelope pore membrane protein POM 121-like [Crocuta crocuta]